MQKKVALFGDSTCPNCGKSFDECLEECPYCHEVNPSRPRELINTHHLWFSYKLQLAFLFIGILGLMIVSVIVSSITHIYISDTATNLLITNIVAYSLVGISFIVLIKFSKVRFLKYFKDYKAYILGIIGFGVLIGLSYAITAIIEQFIKVSPGENQKAVIALVQTYPVISFILLAIIGPIIEEITYRIGFFSFFCRFNRILAYILTILLFTFIHLDFTSKEIVNELISIPDYILGAVILTVSYDLRGPVASTTVHILNNIFSVILILAGVNV